MAVISTTTKGKLGAKAAKNAVAHPTVRKAAAPAIQLAFAVAKRRGKRQLKRAQETAETIGTALTVYGPQVAYELGLAEPPKEKKTAPRVLAGAALGAGAVLALEHREKLTG